nr:hypothetical protein [Tanacetum cinerariifolium]
MVEPTAMRLLILVLLIMTLNSKRHFIIANSISIVLFLLAFPMVTRRSDIPKGWYLSYEKPTSRALHLLSLDRVLTLRFLKQCSYMISDELSPKEAEGSVVKKFFGQGEQVQETPDANKGEAFNLSKKLQEKSTKTPRAWRLYLGKETIKEGLAAYVSKGMKDLHVLMDLPKLVAQIEGNHTPVTEQEKRVGNHKVRICQSRSIGRYQKRTIDGGDKQQQEGKSDKQCTRSKAKLQLGN